MRIIEGEQVFMRIFIGESDVTEGKALYMALLELFKKRGLAGATVLRGIAGYGARSHIHSSHLLELSRDLPMIIEVVDSQEHLDEVLPDVEKLMNGGLITMEKARVIHYGFGNAK
jgi:PII-like signaling protein